MLLLGAGGFIGRHVLAALLARGHAVTAVVRRPEGLADAFPAATVLTMDLARATTAGHWHAALAGIDAVVNAAGVLRGPDMGAVHTAMPAALHRAALAAGVRRIVLLSAISARPDVATDYACTKLAGEADLRRSGLDWTILRPSLVYGEGSYGGTSLLRGLAALPLLVPLPGDGAFAFTPIHVADLADDVARITADPAFIGRTLEPVGPRTLDLRELLGAYRAWLGFGRTRFLPVPMPLMRLLGRVGDRLGDGPVSTNSLVQMIAGNAGSSADYAAAIGHAGRDLTDALRAHPAQVQDRWHARLFFLAPAVRAVLVALWLASALLGLWQGEGQTRAVVAALGLPAALAAPLQVGSSLLDLALAVLVARDGKARTATLAQLAVVAGYTVVIGLALPGLWLDPLGPLLKNLPILALIAVHGVIGDSR